MRHTATQRIDQLTVRGLDPRLQEEIHRLARREGVSLNQAALRLLEKGAELPRRPERTVGDSLDHLIGTWSETDARAFTERIRSCEQVDSEFWK